MNMVNGIFMDFNKLKERLTALALIEEVPAAPPAAPAKGEEEQPPAEPTAPVSRPAAGEINYPARGFHFDVKVAADSVVEAATILDEEGFFLEAVTGVDWIKEKELEVVYDFTIWQPTCRVVVRTRLNREAPEVPTISGVCPGANWHERETHDFFGIKFSGHPDLTPLLLPEDADFHPLLKDFQV